MRPPSASVLDQAGDALGGYLPRGLGALALLVVGLLLARVVRSAVVRGLRAAGLDARAEAYGVQRVLTRSGLGSASAVIGAAVRLTLSVAVVFASLSLLGLQALDESLNAGVLFLPRGLVALALVLAGLVVAELVRERVDRLAGQLDVQGPVGAVVGVAVLAVFVVTALAEVGVPTVILLVLVAVAFSAAALTASLAFGLGGREVARELNARRYVAASFAPGEEITVGDVRGEIVGIEPAATVLRALDGRTVRVPNHLLVESVVTVHPRPLPPRPAGATAAGS